MRYFSRVFVSYAECLSVRRPLIPAQTDAFRVIDGEGDGCPGVFVDQLADRILVSTRDRDIPGRLLAELLERNCPVFHKRLDRNVKEAPVRILEEDSPTVFTIREQGVVFKIDMSAGYSQGIFLDQRENRRRVRERTGEGRSILNTFAYTGAFSVYAALAGGVATTLDLSQPSLDWARDNFKLNGISPDGQFFCKGDTFRWLERFARQGRRFDGIILDPPTFSRNEDGRVFRVESHYGDLVRMARACLESDGWILCTTNCRHLAPREFLKMVRSSVEGGSAVVCGMPPDFRGEQYLKTVWLDFSMNGKVMR